ncbi:hypothetical protein EDD18DRAFT_1019374, partial [Armillaria luteobubalina]
LGYAIWLVPSDTETAALSKLMELHPKSYTQDSQSHSYPSFDPHITLVTFDKLPSSFNLESISLDLLTLPVVHFDSIKRGNSYLGAFSIVISPVSELMPLHDTVTSHLDVLSISWKSRSFPHMSLFYIDKPDKRDRLHAELINERRIQGDECLMLTASLSMEVTTFTGSEIWLVDCMCSVKRWQVIVKRSLVSPAPPSLLKEEIPQKQT